jgi:hypothetical protein
MSVVHYGYNQANVPNHAENTQNRYPNMFSFQFLQTELCANVAVIYVSHGIHGIHIIHQTVNATFRT